MSEHRFTCMISRSSSVNRCIRGSTMKKSGLSVMILGAFLALSGSSAVAQQEEVDVQKLANEWSKAYNGHNRAALGKLYTPDARLMMHGSPTIAGRARIEDYWA